MVVRVRAWEDEDGKLFVASPYNEEFIREARGLRGRWSSARRVWVFDALVRPAVAELCVRCYGEWNLLAAAPADPGEPPPAAPPTLTVPLPTGRFLVLQSVAGGDPAIEVRNVGASGAEPIELRIDPARLWDLVRKLACPFRDPQAIAAAIAWERRAWTYAAEALDRASRARVGRPRSWPAQRLWDDAIAAREREWLALAIEEIGPGAAAAAREHRLKGCRECQILLPLTL